MSSVHVSNEHTIHDDTPMVRRSNAMGNGAQAMLPSAVMPGITPEQTQIDTPSQQGSTMPGDGTEVHVEPERSKGLSGTFNKNIPFKERAVGGAQKVRGTLLGNEELKEHGQAILDGRTTHKADKKRH